MFENISSQKQQVGTTVEDTAIPSAIRIAPFPAKKSLVNSFFIVLFAFWATLYSQEVYAAGVTVAWDVDPEPDIAMYRVFYGTKSNDYTDSVTVPNPQDNPNHLEVGIDGLTEGVRYYFSVKAIDTAGQESDAAPEASIVAPYGFDGSDLASQLGNIDWLEAGTIHVGSEWTTVTLSKSFEQPVVIVSPVSGNDSDPCTVRVADVTDNSFSVRVQEWEYLDGTHDTEILSYIVVEAGSHEMPDGTLWQAGIYELSGIREFVHVDFPSMFHTLPVVFQTVQTENEADAVAIREKDISMHGFSSAMDEQESLRDGHAEETVGYLAVEKSVEGSSCVIGVSNATHEIMVPPGTNGLYLQLQEEQSKDEEMRHIREKIGYMQIGDLVLAQVQTFNGGDTCMMRYLKRQDPAPALDDEWYREQDWIEVGSVNITNEWTTVTLQHSFADPVVIVGPPTYNGHDPSLVRIRNVNSNSFELRIQEWNYNNGIHVTEAVPWMVVEAGAHTLPDGTVWEAGLYEMNGTNRWNVIPLTHKTGMYHVILQTVQSLNGADAVTTRLTSVSSYSFKSAFQEEEARNEGHTIETVGYLAVPLISRCPVGIVSLNHNFGKVGEGLPELRIEEERSKDFETIHVYEDVGYVTLGHYFFGQIQTFHGGDTAVLRMR